MSTPTHDPAIIAEELILLDADLGESKDAVIERLSDLLAGAGRATDATPLRDAALAREAQSATGLPGGIAIPHCRDEAVTSASLGFARLNPKVDFGAPDGPADLVFLIAAPAGAGSAHMKLLSSLARALVKPEFVASLRNAPTPTAVVELVEAVINPAAKKAGTSSATAPPRHAASDPTPDADAGAIATPDTRVAAEATPRHIVAVTACPTGIAHTYMAADSLVAAGDRAGVTVHVETQGSSGSTPLDPALIASAAAVIFATQVGDADSAKTV